MAKIKEYIDFIFHPDYGILWECGFGGFVGCEIEVNGININKYKLKQRREIICLKEDYNHKKPVSIEQFRKYPNIFRKEISALEKGLILN